jgi:hypothetical protein
MTAFQRSVLASTAAQESEETPGPTPAVYEAPTIATVGIECDPRSRRRSHAPSESLTAII